MIFWRLVFKALPLIPGVFSVWIINVCVRIIRETGGSTFLLNTLAVQVYLNWIAILLASRNCVGAKRDSLFSSTPADYYSDKIEQSKYADTQMNADKKKFRNSKRFNHRNGNQNYIALDDEIDSLVFSSENIEKLWYCQKCCLNTREMCHHCPICNKCIMGRDHHCFLLGTCIGKQNMTHFIVILFYGFMACLYTNKLLCSRMNLYNQSWQVIFQHLFPISFTKWLIGQEYLEKMLDILLMNVTGTVALFSFIFGIYYLFHNIGICPANDLTLNKLISIKLRAIYKGGFVSAFLNLIFPVSLLNCFLDKTNLVSIGNNRF